MTDGASRERNTTASDAPSRNADSAGLAGGSAPRWIRVSYDFRTPVWQKFGGVVYVERESGIEAAIRTNAGPDAEITIVEQRAATVAEAERHRRFQAWALRWKDAAARAEAGRHLTMEPWDEQWRETR